MTEPSGPGPVESVHSASASAHISHAVIATYSAAAAVDVDGVAGIAGGPLGASDPERAPKGVRVSGDGVVVTHRDDSWCNRTVRTQLHQALEGVLRCGPAGPDGTIRGDLVGIEQVPGSHEHRVGFRLDRQHVTRLTAGRRDVEVQPTALAHGEAE